jgi:hypothetical protein
MKQYSIAELKAEFAKHNYQWFPFHFIGIRSKANISNQFDDLFGIIQGDNIRWFSCTTNAGTHWLINLMNTKGTAMLKPNQYVDTWEIGLHQGKYEAFKQCKPVEVYRDGDKDNIAEETSVIDKGLFGINIHRANEKAISKLIDKWSAGCQVLNNPADFAILLNSAKTTKQKYFTYTLLREF